MRKLYVCSRPLIDSDNTKHRHLLGILSQHNGKYQFRYILDDDASSGLLLSMFPDKNKIYDDKDTHLLLDDYLPSENDTAFMREILRKTGLSHYDEWEWLKTFDSADDNAETRLYETLPDDVIIHGNIDCFVNGENTNDDMTDDDMLDTDDGEDNSNQTIGHVDLSKNDDDELSTDFEALEDLDDENINELLDEDMFVFDDDAEHNTNEPSETEIIDGLPEEQSEPLVVDEVNSIATQPDKKTKNIIVTKTITHRVKRSNDPSDFISPPPADPSDIIQQRLEQNIIQRQKELAKKLETSE